MGPSQGPGVTLGRPLESPLSGSTPSADRMASVLKEGTGLCRARRSSAPKSVMADRCSGHKLLRQE